MDGQHRFYICQKLKRAVHYIIVGEIKTMVDIAKINSNVEKWKQIDFINCYVVQGNEDYKKLKEFLDTYQISIGTATQLLSIGTPGAGGQKQDALEKFENGTFKISYWNEAVELAELCKRFEKNSLSKDRSFFIAIHRIKKAEMIQMDDLVAAFNKNPEMLTKQVSQKEYINNLERIINVGKHKRIVII